MDKSSWTSPWQILGNLDQNFRFYRFASPTVLNRRHASPAVRKDKLAHCSLLTTTNSGVYMDCSLLMTARGLSDFLHVLPTRWLHESTSGVDNEHPPQTYTLAPSHSTNSATLLTRIV